MLSADKFDKTAPTQTLVITLGKPGIGFDPDTVFNQVLDAYSQRTFLVTVEDVETLKEPDPVDLEKLYKEFYIAPVNAAVDTKTGKTTSGSYGYEFDRESAQKLLDEAEFGDEVRIPMQYIEPDILDANGFFADTLGEYQTRASGSDERLTNLRIACEAINGRVLNPGEGLSFRDAISSLSLKSASDDIGLESTSGGGVTQVSSTLYCAALLSDLTVSSRSNLSYLPSFINSLPELRSVLHDDVEAIYNGDPAATSYEEVIYCYPSVKAITNYRLAHEFMAAGVPIIPRMMTELAHNETGIDIHPGGRILLLYYARSSYVLRRIVRRLRFRR